MTETARKVKTFNPLFLEPVYQYLSYLNRKEESAVILEDNLLDTYIKEYIFDVIIKKEFICHGTTKDEILKAVEDYDFNDAFVQKNNGAKILRHYTPVNQLKSHRKLMEGEKDDIKGEIV